ncbi:MAG: hypothetical protein AVDCRST_MAG85-1199, partial [uncultured Solirubrobacteraceae bacterium]
ERAGRPPRAAARCRHRRPHRVRHRDELAAPRTDPRRLHRADRGGERGRVPGRRRGRRTSPGRVDDDDPAVDRPARPRARGVRRPRRRASRPALVDLQPRRGRADERGRRGRGRPDCRAGAVRRVHAGAPRARVGDGRALRRRRWTPRRRGVGPDGAAQRRRALERGDPAGGRRRRRRADDLHQRRRPHPVGARAARRPRDAGPPPGVGVGVGVGPPHARGHRDRGHVDRRRRRPPRRDRGHARPGAGRAAAVRV